MKAKLTYELIEQMCALKADGLSNQDVCRAVGIHESTLYRWLNNPSTKLHRALGEEYKKAEAGYKQTLLNTIRAAALDKHSNWTAAAWLLERKYPDEFGRVDRRRDEPKQAEVPQIVLGVAVAKADGGSAAGLPPSGAGEPCGGAAGGEPKVAAASYAVEAGDPDGAAGESQVAAGEPEGDAGDGDGEDG